MNEYGQGSAVAKSQQDFSHAESGVCKSHEFIARTLDTLVAKVDTGFADVSRTLTQIQVEIGRREESELSQWREIRSVKDKVEELPGKMAEALDKHVTDCPLQDITEVGFKVQKDRRRQERYDTPNGGMRRSTAPRGSRFSTRTMVMVGAGVAAVIVALGIFIGVWLSTGSPEQAKDTIRDLKQHIVPSDQQPQQEPRP